MAKEIQKTENKADVGAEIEKLSAPQSVSFSPAPRVRKFLVLKEYCGIAEGEEIASDNPSTISYMVKNGFWKEA